ncbi:hypothetical protein P1P68_29145 [Streptomyces scabiei]|uniref:hypothetical protein n=1 Tax=Streptomyces scabiei TaxID=1930 RepID=UPI0029901DA9|nr:hypothetical protein [Streptomyces scabiei]MDW8808750.1 hypothetical protein [Streptomyces scabiei]
MTTVVQDSEAALAGIPDSAWERLAELAGQSSWQGEKVDADHLRNMYADKVQQFLANPDRHLTANRQLDVRSQLQVTKTDDGTLKLGPYELSFFDIIGVTLEGDFTPGEHWSANLKASLKIVGAVVWQTEYSLSPEHASIHINPSLPIASLDATVGLYGSKLCLRISGEGCYWWFGWNCQKFDETLVCFL